MRTWKVISAGAVVLVLAACALVRVALTVPPPLNVSVSFAGYTNDLSGTRFAVFMVSNESDVAIKRWGIYHVEAQGDPQLHGPFFYGRSPFIGPGQ